MGRIGQGAAAVAVAGVLVVPWMVHNAQAGKGFALSPPAMMLAYIQANVAYLEKYAAGVSLAEAERKTYGWENGYASARGAEWAAMSEREKKNALIGDYTRALFSYDLSVIAKGYVYGWAQFFGAAGAANFHNLLGLDASIAALRGENRHRQNLRGHG
jgi:hypothetical protein